MPLIIMPLSSAGFFICSPALVFQGVDIGPHSTVGIHQQDIWHLFSDCRMTDTKCRQLTPIKNNLLLCCLAQ